MDALTTQQHLALPTAPIMRGYHDQILMATLDESTRQRVTELFEAASTAEKVDEHGNWNFNAAFDRAGRGVAINWDLYAVGRDLHDHKLLIVVQIRRWEKRTRNGYPNVHKSYFLLGRNEDNTAFAHPVSAQVVRRAINRNADVVRACQDWMFGAPYERVLRQGDVCLVPVRSRAVQNQLASTAAAQADERESDADRADRRPAERPGGEPRPPQPGSEFLQGSHHLRAQCIVRKDEQTFALDPDLEHLPGIHPTLLESGWYKVIIARRGKIHDFASMTVD